MQAYLDRLRNRFGARRVNWLAVLLLIGISSTAVQFLVRQKLDSSSLLYVATPYLCALAIVILRPRKSKARWWHQYRDFTLTSLIVLLASSIVLFEGFICILFIFPIYFLIVSLAFFLDLWLHRAKTKGGKMCVALLPMVVLASSFEGSTELLSAERTAYVQASRIVEIQPEQIMTNLLRPVELSVERNWILSIFPMPYRVETGSLEKGAIHRMYTRYHRWFVTNTHEGEVHIEIVDVQPNRLRTRVVHDTSFFSTYLNQVGSELTLTRTASNSTEISLRLTYRRNLDPAWYFHPLQQFAMHEMAAFFIDEVLAREAET
ncbi:hypothetical protein [Candidatus Foliamicus sp.]